MPLAMSSQSAKSAGRTRPGSDGRSSSDYVHRRRLANRRLRARLRSTTRARNCLLDTLGCGLEALDYPACTKLLGPDRAGHRSPQRRARAGDPLPAGSGAGRLQHRRHDPLARFQRHLARGRVGPPLRQSRRHPRRRRLALPHARSPTGKPPLTMRDVLDRHDQGARNPGLHRAGEFLQPGRARSRRAGQGRLHRRGRQLLGLTREQIINALSLRLGRRPEPAHLPPRAQHRLAQKLGRRRRHQPRRAPGADRARPAKWVTRRR